MKFFNDPKEFTHWARFYGIPCYLHMDTVTLAGRNVIFDWMLLGATLFHNYVVEFGAQTAAYILDREYEPGFPIYVMGALWPEYEDIVS